MQSGKDKSNRHPITRSMVITAVTIVAALGAFVGVGAAHTGIGIEHTHSILQHLDVHALQVGQEFCDTEGGGLLESGVGFAGLIFVAGVVVAIFIAATLESFPLTGWFNTIAFSMMGKIPIAIMFVFLAFTFLTVALGTYGITAPSCVPVIGG